MKYFIDLEFLEGTQKEKFPISLFRKNTPPTIDIISIGIVAEDGRELYLISKDFNLKEAWNRYDLKNDNSVGARIGCKPPQEKVYWIRENVLKPIWRELFFKADDCIGLSNSQVRHYEESVKKGGYDNYFTLKSLEFLISKFGKTNKEIAEEIISFVYPLEQWKELHKGSYIDRNSLCLGVGTFATIEELLQYSVPQIEKPKFFAYYADYDWVAFCWLFGKMIDLPKGFPMYCNDLKQTLDEKTKLLTNAKGKIELVSEVIPEHGCAMSAEFNSIKDIGGYPSQENEHNALADARWNKKLHEFLNTL